ncbi:thioesterase [Nocardiopsis gilva YIM 90087]|uniref:Thioesterase n=1 Tax=Nocardiopsis gilva YIM 90087 TaxID=1235441 RepID=A0A223SB48_9ACTN|nr:alpha/beta fold hydrolase [Nocardiopsis gilva]ASU85322.1 thioesterase [Nocardiopsis gilva YIM 90087]
MKAAQSGERGGNGAWIRRFHPAPEARTRLVCFPHAGGSATFFHPVSQAMSPAVDVLAIQYPGRQDRRSEPCVDDIEKLAELVVPELRAWTDRPVAMFGHSMGASLAFEVARRLEQEGVTATGLFVSGRRAPTAFRDERVHLADDDRIITELKRMSGTDAAVLGDEEILRMILPAVRADYRAAETYRYTPGPDVSCPIIAMTGDDDAQVTLDEARMWADHTSGGFNLHVYEGGHFFLTAHAAAVMKVMTDHIESRSPVRD